jgi:hypothetical protein
MYWHVRWLNRGVLVILCAFFVAAAMPPGAVLAQDEQVAAKPAGPNRGGFTLLLTMGVGLQNNAWIDESGVGIGGLNLGIGGFVSPDLAVMFRISGTNVRFENVGFFNSTVDMVSGVGGVSVQYWVNDFVNLEGGAGFGLADTNVDLDERGFGLILGAGFSFFHRGKNSLQVGIEYAPVFLDVGNIHNICITFGWQLL